MNLAQKLDNAIKGDDFNGVILIEKNNEIIFYKAYGYQDKKNNILNNIKTKFGIASITKQFTAALILKLYEDNRLKLDDTLDMYLPEYEIGKKITVHQVLSNCSGIANFSLDIDFTSFVESEDVTKALVDYIISLPLMFEPGSKFYYSISGYLILQYIIENITGLSYEDYLKESFLDKLNMENTGVLSPNNNVLDLAIGYDSLGDNPKLAINFDMRIAGGGGALYSNATDLLQWEKALLNNQVLQKDNTNLMFTKHIKADEVNNYGYGFVIAQGMINGKQRLKYYHPGGGFGIRTFLTIYPENNITVIMLSNLGDAKIFNNTRTAIDKLLLEE